MRRIKTMLTIAGSLVMAGEATAAPPPEVQIGGLSYQGSGCPSGSVAGLISPDLQAFTLAYSQFYAEAGPQVRPQARRKDCRVTVDLVYPEGWQYTVFRVDYRGFAALEDGTWGMQHVIAKFRGGGVLQRPSRMRLEGPYNNDYMLSDEIGITPRGAWSSCRGNQANELTLDTWIHVGGQHGKYALMAVDSTDGVIVHNYAIAWRQCPS